jgi:NADH-quinone oxidoreductase subunit N
MILLTMPEIQLLVLAVALLVYEAFVPSVAPRKIAYVALAGVVLVFIGTWCTAAQEQSLWPTLYQADALAVFFKRFFLVTLFFVLWMSSESINELPLGRSEFLILPLFTTTGMMLLASAVNFMTIFVALELVTISFYVLVAYQRNKANSLEAGTKYLIVGALSTGFLVYGIAFLYGAVGNTSLSGLALALAKGPVHVGFLFAALLILVGLGFKMAAVPFHVWAPDVYHGAPTPVTAFLAVGSKAAGFVILLRVFAVDGFKNETMMPLIASVLGLMAGLSILLGNLAALPQRNLKRLLGYSSISHAGFLLMGVSCLSERGVQSVLLYLLVYALSTLLAFYIINRLSMVLGGDELPLYAGLSQRSPLLAFSLMLALVSMAGIPPLAGFIGKLGVFAAVWETGNYLLFGVGVAGAASGLYYYLKVVREMYWQEPQRQVDRIILGLGSKLLLATLSSAIVLLGIWQIPLARLVGKVLSP